MTVVALLAGCSAQEEDLNYGKGGLLISLGNEEVEVSMRATPAELGVPEPVFFHLSATKDDTGDVIYNGDFKTRIVSALPGNYTLQATCGEDVILGWDTPYYIGTAQAEVLNGQTTEITIPCKVGNSLVSVRYANPELFDQLYSDYALKVFVEPYSISIDAAQAERSAYLRAGSDVQISFVATTLEGTEVDYSLNKSLEAYLPLQAADHAIITLSASNFGVNVSKVEVKQVTVQETIPMEWLPKPKLANFGNGTNALETVETNDAIAASIGYTAAMPIEDFEFTLNFEDPQYTGLNKTYTLSTLSDADRTALTGIGIVLPTLNTQSGSLDLTNLTGKLVCANGGAIATNRFTLRVKANNRWSDAQEYSIKTHAPQFNITVNENDFWSKEFAVRTFNVTSGNAAKVNSNVVYQYSADGTTWTTCNNGMKHKFSSHPATKNYKVRALYRGTVPSASVDVTLETPTQLPNSGMEEWSDESYKGSGNLRTYYPWSSGGSSYWMTNNEFTTRYRQGTFGAAYNSFPAVSYVQSPHSGSLAAEIRSTGSGASNTLPSNVRNVNKVAGILFTGDFSANTGASPGDNFTRTNGKDFNVRPSALQFWYKYAPYNNDTWQAHIELWDENKSIIISQDYTSSSSQSNYTQITLNLNYADGTEYKKCKYIYVLFRSTVNEGKNMPYQKNSYTLYYDQGSSTRSYKNVFFGSILTIDDISLVYDK